MSTVKQLVDLSTADFIKMSKKERAAVVTQLVSAANKRVKRLEALMKVNPQEKSPALTILEKEHIKKFSSKGLSNQGLIKEFVLLKRFMRAKTSTVKGFKEFKDKYKQNTGMEWGSYTSNLFWDVYNETKNRHPNLWKHYSSEQIQDELDKILVSSVKTDINALADELYEAMMGIKKQDSFDGVNLDDLFDLGSN